MQPSPPAVACWPLLLAPFVLLCCQAFALASPQLAGDYRVPRVFSEDLFEVLGEEGRPDYRCGMGLLSRVVVGVALVLLLGKGRPNCRCATSCCLSIVSFVVCC
jgi:hypothetical protein